MKRLSALLVLLLVCSSSQLLKAQTTDSWVSVPLKGDLITVWMPNNREVKTREFTFEHFKLEGSVYTATEDGVDYIAWTLLDKGDGEKSPPTFDSYNDACADLVWESLLKPRRDDVPKEPKTVSRMSYQRELSWANLLSGREYSIMLANRPGLARFFAADRQIYVLIILNEDANNAGAQTFVNSFGPKRSERPRASDLTLMEPATGIGLRRGAGGGIGPGTGGGMGLGTDDDVRPGGIGMGLDPAKGSEVEQGARGPIDYNRIFSGKEVTQKARILSKPEPSYTESARKYSVTGTVVMRAVFSSSGEVTHIRVFSGLPHGLTRRAMDAAKGIKFTPATKDGHDVSMWFQLEYNFNLY